MGRNFGQQIAKWVNILAESGKLYPWHMHVGAM